MSLGELKVEAAQLASGEQRELIAHLVALQTSRNEDLQQELARKVDDQNPARWAELEDVQKRYAE